MIKLALIGTGGMGAAHAQTYANMKGVRIVACCDVVPGKAAEFADKHGMESAYTDPDEMLDNEKVDGVIVATSDNAHFESSLKAIHRKIPVFCEKPLSDNLADARKMAREATKRGVITAVNFSYRNSFATQKAAQLVASGKIGDVRHVEGHYFQDWLSPATGVPWDKFDGTLWRLSTKHGSLGTLGDIGVHLYDLACFVVGDIRELQCDLRTFDKGRKKVREYVLDANDSFVSAVRFVNGALGTLHSTRYATGHGNTVALRVYGTKAALDLNLDRPPEEQLLMCKGRKNNAPPEWTPVKCPAKPDTYRRFITGIRTGKPCQTNFEQAALIQACLEASMKSDAAGGYVKVK